ncbi:hypothetical protein Chor_001227 [Crotalus horridus]
MTMDSAVRSAVLIQRWYRRYVARLEMRRRCTWRDFLNRILSETDNMKRIKLEKGMESMEVPVSYRGPRLSFPLTPDDAVNILEAFRNNQQLHPYYVLKLFQEAEHHLSQLPNINRISTCYSEEITVCGDLHGQIFDLFHIFYKNGLPSPQKLYVFNGDFVDRGKHSIEILIILFVFLLIYPKEDHANRLLAVIKNVFSSLPLATVIDRKVLIILSVLTPKRRKSLEYIPAEGGKLARSSSTIKVSQGGQQTVQEDARSSRMSPGVQKIPGPSSSVDSEDSNESTCYEDDDIEQVVDILWSDPDPRPGCTMNLERGGGCYFGPDVTDMFLQKHRLQFIIRSHECKPEGYEFNHNRKVITIFSASNYYAVGSNRGAYIKLGPDLIPHVVQISRVEESAYQILKEQLFAHRSELTVAFKSYDRKNTEFQQTWKLFSSHMNINISDENIRNLARSIDFNKDGRIDFNEFLEAFRLVRQPAS